VPHKLLLADDSVTIQRVIELTFAGEDMQVLTAGDGEQAIASIQAERPDIVLADIGMPKRSGYDVATFVKSSPELAHIPVLLLTGAFEPVDETRARATGCDGVLVKPFEPQHVIARVRELLESGSRRMPRESGSVTRAVSDVPRPAERLAPQRQRATAPGDDFDLSLPAAPTTTGVSETSLDEYFDRLDAAFANIAPQGSETPPPARPTEPTNRHDGPVLARDLDWFDSPPQPVTPPAPVREEPVPPPVEPMPATFASPPSVPSVPAWSFPQQAPIEPPDSPAVIAPQSAEPRARVIHVPAADSGSSIADAFSALLAVEQGEPGAVPVRLAMSHSAPPVNDEMVEEITRRVIERLGPDAARDLVADVVSRVAERLVREEIQRIRNKQT
jgi:DNA-binding response OmpR family regulator